MFFMLVGGILVTNLFAAVVIDGYTATRDARGDHARIEAACRSLMRQDLSAALAVRLYWPPGDGSGPRGAALADEASRLSGTHRVRRAACGELAAVAAVLRIERWAWAAVAARARPAAPGAPLRRDGSAPSAVTGGRTHHLYMGGVVTEEATVAAFTDATDASRPSHHSAAASPATSLAVDSDGRPARADTVREDDDSGASSAPAFALSARRRGPPRGGERWGGGAVRAPCPSPAD
eukprot:gene50696-58800_t